MRAELANLNHCAAQILSRADANLRWYYYINAIRPLHSCVRSTKVQKSTKFLNLDWSFPIKRRVGSTTSVPLCENLTALVLPQILFNFAKTSQSCSYG